MALPKRSDTFTSPALICFTPDNCRLPAPVAAWLARLGGDTITINSEDELMSFALRSRPGVVIFDARVMHEASLSALRRLKADSYTAVVPSAFISGDGAKPMEAGFDAGADEVLTKSTPDESVVPRLDAMIRRSERDLSVHPSTRLAGAAAIEVEIGKRLATGEAFAVCYADLDHFKEFNDRYSYNHGDRVIRILAKLLHDVVKGLCGERGFIGHIGGDDFIFIIPYDMITEVCGEIVATFDILAPYQYSEQDRRAGYFFGKDRRGHLDRVPLMTLSIGVVTNLKRNLTNAGQVSQLATEMKTYAKSLPGSIYTVDRRCDERMTPPEQRPAIDESLLTESK